MAKKSEELKARIESIEKTANEFIGKLETELELAKEQRFTKQAQDDLKNQIAKARATYDGILAPVRGELDAARAVEDLEYKQALAQIEQTAAETKETIKAEKLKSWIAAGGALAGFDEIFESKLYPEEMTKRAAVQEIDQADVDQSKRAARNLIRDGFDRF